MTVRVEDAWAEHRPYLVNLAFRMLGDIREAEDVVSEAFARLLASDAAGIDDARGWLIVVTSRLCLDQIRSARRRLQRPQDLDAIESRLPGSGPSFADPADRVTLDDRVRLALTVVLDRLTPAERVVFVLHDIFGLPFETVAETVGRTAQACRQLARRARIEIDSAATGTGVGADSKAHRLVTQRFIQACATGDLAGLLDALDPAAAGWIDLFPEVVTTGAPAVAGNLLRFWQSPPAQLVAISYGLTPLLLGFLGGELRALIELTMSDGLITEIHVITAPEALAVVRAALHS
jgi:RNA polymerase sigma-70 factor (ECF subfamily)